MARPDLAAWSLPLGVALDAALGDPRDWPHPVRLIGGLIERTERVLRSAASRRTGGAPAGRARRGGRPARWSWSGWPGWPRGASDRSGDAPRRRSGGLVAGSLADLLGPGGPEPGRREPCVASEAPDLVDGPARARDDRRPRHGDLDAPEICRACVETVAENCNDARGRPPVLVRGRRPGRRSGSTRRSTRSTAWSATATRVTAGLGWASARLDDLAGLGPRAADLAPDRVGRLGSAGRTPLGALRIGWRDGRKHPSPNAAWGEAAMAGALGVQLGGPATYGGLASVKPLLGDPGAADRPATRSAGRSGSCSRLGSGGRAGLGVFWPRSGLA